jgi:hypothetical protein
LLARFSTVMSRRLLAGFLLVVVVVTAVVVLVGGASGVGRTGLINLILRGRCSLRMRVPVSLQLTHVRGNLGSLHVTGDGLPSRVTGVCVPGGTLTRIVAVESRPGSVEKLANHAAGAVLTQDGGAVTYVAPLTGGVLAFGQRGTSVNPALRYLIEHTRGRILRCSPGDGGCVALRNTASPNTVAIKPPAGLSGSQRATFLAGAAIAGETGCEGCHEIGGNGNNGPGEPLTHIGADLRPAQIDASLRNPKAPMPSFSNLAKASPKKFRELVQFLAMLK